MESITAGRHGSKSCDPWKSPLVRPYVYSSPIWFRSAIVVL